MKNGHIILFLAVYLCLFFSEKLTAQESSAFMTPPVLKINQEITEEYPIAGRKFTGIPSLAVSAEGRMWAVWYSGKTPEEDANNYVVVSTSNDHGKTWKETLIIDPDKEGPVRAFDPEVWVDPDGKLWVFWTQAIGHDGSIAGVWAITANNADTDNPEWSKPRRLTDGVMMCKPVVLSNGTWILPASTWKQTDNSARMVVSKDKGKTWMVRGAVNVPVEARLYDEHSIVEKKDGKLWMLLRTMYGIGESFSKDQGKTWSPLVPSVIQHPSARFFVRRLKSGSLLLVKHGPIGVKTGRSHLMAFISKDDGVSWSKGLLLDERNGVSYPDGQQVKDGTINIIYDYNRRKEQMILMTSFKEEDVFAADYDVQMVHVYNRRKIISENKGTK
ncbi:MAG: sialidase family protein [Bacteroidales bacterium]|nr:sialidase family protein [Bacteroidales bacterium]